MNEKLRYEVTVDGVNKANSDINSLGGSFEDVAKKALVFSSAIIGITKGFSLASESAKLFFQQQASENMVAQALKTTGNVAGVTTEQLKKAASELQDLSNFGDEKILAEVSNSLLTFKNIAGDTFMRTQQVVVDMAAKFGSLQNSAMQVGFALNDPIEGLTRLRRTGVQFTDDQEELIKSLTETGRVAEAQAIVLSELESQFGGLAKATIDPFVQMENAISDMKEEIGRAFAPMFKNFSALAKYMKDNEGLVNAFGLSLKIAIGVGVGLVVAFTLKMKTLATVIATVKGLAGDWLSLLIGAGAGIATTVALTTDFTKAQNNLGDAINKTNDAMERKQSLVMQDNKNRAEEIRQTLSQLEAQKKVYESSLRMQRSKALKIIPNLKGDEIALKGIISKINELTKELEELSKVEEERVNNKDISALKQYYDLVKYQDSDYLDWRIAMNEKEADALYENLLKRGFQIQEAEEKRQKYLEESNRTVQQNYRSHVSEMEKIADSYRPQLESEVVAFDWSMPEGVGDALEKQKALMENYYNAVKFLDDDYYNYRKANIMMQAEAWEKAGQDEVAIAEWKNERIKELNQEQTDFNLAKTRETTTGMAALYQQFQASVQGMQFDFLNGWDSFTKSILSSFKSMINQMLSQLVTSGLLTLLASLSNPGTAGIGLFGSIFGNPFKSIENTPIGTVNPIAEGNNIANIPTPTGTRSTDSGMSQVVNKLNEVVTAIKEYGIADKIQVITDVNLARRVEYGNLERGVL